MAVTTQAQIDWSVAPFADGGWGCLLFRAAEAYTGDYVYSTDGPDHAPTAWERELLADFFAGLMADEGFMRVLREMAATPPPQGEA